MPACAGRIAAGDPRARRGTFLSSPAGTSLHGAFGGETPRVAVVPHRPHPTPSSQARRSRRRMWRCRGNQTNYRTNIRIFAIPWYYVTVTNGFSSTFPTEYRRGHRAACLFAIRTEHRRIHRPITLRSRTNCSNRYKLMHGYPRYTKPKYAHHAAWEGRPLPPRRGNLTRAKGNALEPANGIAPRIGGGELQASRGPLQPLVGFSSDPSPGIPCPGASFLPPPLGSTSR